MAQLGYPPRQREESGEIGWAETPLALVSHIGLGHLEHLEYFPSGGDGGCWGLSLETEAEAPTFQSSLSGPKERASPCPPVGLTYLFSFL